jgi:hypothetical protein
MVREWSERGMCTTHGDHVWGGGGGGSINKAGTGRLRLVGGQQQVRLAAVSALEAPRQLDIESNRHVVIHCKQEHRYSVCKLHSAEMHDLSPTLLPLLLLLLLLLLLFLYRNA